MKRIPPLTPLVSFRAAAFHQSFTRAAEELHLTHGAVSKAVKQLEEYYGVRLFHRRNRGIYLTAKGRQLYLLVDRMLGELEKISEQMKVQETSHRISVSCEPSLSMRWLMPRLEGFHESHPGIEVHISTAGGPIDLSKEGVHLAIRRSDFSWPGSYHATTLGSERIAPVCSPSYWEKYGHGAKQILHTRTRKEAWADWNSYAGIVVEADSEQFYDHFYFSLQAAVAGLGMAIGPEPLVADDIAQELLVAPYGFVSTPATYVVLSLESPGNDERLDCFVSWLTEEIQLDRTVQPHQDS